MSGSHRWSLACYLCFSRFLTSFAESYAIAGAWAKAFTIAVELPYWNSHLSHILLRACAALSFASPKAWPKLNELSHRLGCLSHQSAHPHPEAKTDKRRAEERERREAIVNSIVPRHASTRHSIEYQCVWVHATPPPPSHHPSSASCFPTRFIIYACLLEPDKAHAPRQSKATKTKVKRRK